MRIVVNNIAASTGGAMTILKDFYSCVCQNDKENQWIFLLADKYFDETDNVKIIPMPEIKKSAIKKVLFDFITGRKFINKLNPDVVFSMQNIMTFGVKAPQIVYLHQSIPFQKVKKFSFFKGSERKIAFIQYFIGSIIKLTVKKCQRVIVQTKWMKDAVSEICSVPEDKISQIPPNVKDIVRYKKEDMFDKRNFFYPTAPALYKNNDCIFKACEILEKQGYDFKVVLTLPKEKSTDKIECIGRIPYEEVLELYNKSTLLFPSYIETFGYPLVEARMLGSIILASDCPFSHEALEGYENGYIFNQFDANSLANLMKKVIDGEIERNILENEKTDISDSWKSVVCEVKSLFK